MNREPLEQALWALKDLIAVYPETACIETRISAQKVIAALEQKLAKPEPANAFYPDWDMVKPFHERIAELEAELAKREHRFDTPESHIVKWSIPVDPNNFGETLAKPEQEFKYTEYGLRGDENGKLSIGEIPRKPWVGLTDDEINDFDKKLRDNGDYCSLHFAWGISAKLKEKNGEN
jgi:hypothetical protein